jgi:predicted TIM-barrel fold metal-dependent hydrolase
MATLALQDPDEAVRELERCVTKLGFKGVMVNGYTQVESPDNLVYLDDARMTPLWEALTALDVPLYLHPHASHNAAMYDNHPELPARTGVLLRRPRRMRCASSMAAPSIRFPTAKLVLGHLGESIPHGAAHYKL